MHGIPNESCDAALTLTDMLEYLPATKRREIARVLEILFDEVERFQASKQSEQKRSGRVLKVILYGSYARGDWVEDRASGYRSDYDLLIVVNTESFAQEDDLWIPLDDRWIQAQVANHIKTPVVAVVHSLHDVNDQLSRGRPFFVDIAKDGKVLYEAEGCSLAEPKPLTKEAAKDEARANFAQWSTLSRDASDLVQVAIETNKLRHGAFLAHQATEEIYHCLLLTLTLYSPKLHRIKRLRSMAEDLDNRLVAAWPRATRLARRRFELLSRAYVEARYSPHYKITTEELGWLTEQIRTLQKLVEEICREHLSSDIDS